jgi:aspartate carbamoyltransferase catalytic subunit
LLKKIRINVVHFDESKSSINKGESLLDTIKTLEAIGINLVISIKKPDIMMN